MNVEAIILAIIALACIIAPFALNALEVKRSRKKRAEYRAAYRDSNQ